LNDSCALFENIGRRDAAHPPVVLYATGDDYDAMSAIAEWLAGAGFSAEVQAATRPENTLSVWPER